MKVYNNTSYRQVLKNTHNKPTKIQQQKKTTKNNKNKTNQQQTNKQTNKQTNQNITKQIKFRTNTTIIIVN